MNVLREALFSVFVIGNVLYIYLLVVAAALFYVCGFPFIGGEPEAPITSGLQRKLISHRSNEAQ